MSKPDNSLAELSDRWDQAGRSDPFWAVLSHPDKSGNRWAQEEFFDTGVNEIRDVMEKLRELNVSVQTGRALDFGCGPGRLSQALVSYFQDVDGVDISPSMIELANRLNTHPKSCHYHLNLAPDLRAFGDSTFDLVYSNITLQHIRPKFVKSYLRDFFRVLRPGGVAVFQLPGRRRGVRSRIMSFIPPPMRAAYRRIRYRHPAAEMHGWRREEVVAYIGGVGAEVVAVEPSEDAGGGWESFRYTVRRRA